MDYSLLRPKGSYRHEIVHHKRYWAHSPSRLRNPCSRGNSKIHRDPLGRFAHPRRPLHLDKGCPVHSVYIRWSEWEWWSLQWSVLRLHRLPPPRVSCKLDPRCSRYPGRRCSAKLCQGSTGSIQICNMELGCYSRRDPAMCFQYLLGHLHNCDQSTWFHTGYEQLAPCPGERRSQGTSGSASFLLLI